MMSFLAPVDCSCSLVLERTDRFAVDERLECLFVAHQGTGHGLAAGLGQQRRTVADRSVG
jgi:hypothetical protein